MPVLMAWLFHLGVSLGIVTLDVPDPGLSKRLEWAQADLNQPLLCSNPSECDDVAIQILASISVGRLESARDALGKVEHRGPLWVFASYNYWLASADRTFLRAQWPQLANVLFRPPVHRIIGDAALELAAADAILAMARELQDTVTIQRVESIYAFADRRAQERGGVLGAALGLINADNADAEIGALVDTVYRQFPLATGFVSLALYEQHRGPEAFALLQAMAAGGLSTSSMFVLPLMRGMIGWEVDAPNRIVSLEPHFPQAWRTATISGLVAGRDTLTVAMRRDDRALYIDIARNRAGAPLTVHLSPALPLGARIRSVKANDIDIPTQIDTNRFDTHVTVELTLNLEAALEIEYDVPPPRPSPR